MKSSLKLVCFLLVLILPCCSDSENEEILKSDIRIRDVIGKTGGIEEEPNGKISYYFELSCSFENIGQGNGRIKDFEFFLDDDKHPDIFSDNPFLENPINSENWEGTITWRTENEKLYEELIEQWLADPSSKPQPENSTLKISNQKQVVVNAGYIGELSLENEDIAYWVFCNTPSLISITLWVEDDNKNSYSITQVRTFENEGIALWGM